MTSVQFDYSKLRGRIREKLGSETKLAEKMGVSAVSLSSKLNNKVGFTNSEMRKVCELLEIDSDDVGSYFLWPKS